MTQKMTVGIDSGYGHTKWACQVGEHCASGVFPSIAVRASSSGGHDVLPVRAASTTFYVGPEAHLCVAGDRDPRQLTDEYCMSDQYYVLTLAALARAVQSNPGWNSRTRTAIVDALVVGLPLSTLQSYQQRLAAKLKGVHLVPNVNDPDGEPVQVEVREVFVIGQPVAVLIWALTTYPELLDKKILVLDSGFYTFDALVAEGKRINRETWSVVKGGNSRYLAEIRKMVSADYLKRAPEIAQAPDLPLFELERVLMAGKPLDLGVDQFNLRDYAPLASARVFKEFLLHLASDLNATLFNAAVLAGGAAEVLAPHFQRQFPHVKDRVFIPKRPQFAIVEGYLIYGCQKLGITPLQAGS